MGKRATTVLLIAGLAVLGTAGASRWWKDGDGAVAQAPAQQGPRGVSVELGRVSRKAMPVVIDALGNVTPIASVAVKSRLETEIVGVHFTDGASVKQGDLLFTLDSRSLEAQIAQAQGTVARDKAQIEGAERDVRRYTELVSKSATPVTNLDNARTQADVFRANLAADEALLKNLQVQLSYATIRAPISGRVSAASVKVGNFVRPADLGPLATIIQTAPVYVTFTTPQRNLPDIREALNVEAGSIEALVPGANRRARGQISMVENTVDPSTGMATVRATMPNDDEVLWPGTLVNVQLTLRTENAIVVPAPAVQVSQQGTFVFVVQDDVARVVPIRVARTVGQESVVEEGLRGDESVVTDGVLQLTNGARVVPRPPRVPAT